MYASFALPDLGDETLADETLADSPFGLNVRSLRFSRLYTLGGHKWKSSGHTMSCSSFPHFLQIHDFIDSVTVLSYSETAGHSGLSYPSGNAGNVS